MAYLISVVIFLAFASAAFASSPQASKKKGTLNTQLYESEGQNTLSGKVKIVRNIQEETEIFIDNPKGGAGPYILPTNIANRSALLKILQKSQKPGGPSVLIGIDNQQSITSVEESEKPSSLPPEL
ncbi:MAG: hypothetical protein IPM97_02335 [Bdellovibrionaceae bacterium]|nr:hypothetical protein [Pseudobdellovibrionaceae bacterium]